jgi:predicted membrane protein
MDTFWIYIQLGFQHISDITAYDHIVFITALVAGYKLKEFRRIVWLVTAFTLGHSGSLALATLGIIPVNATLIEFLIPVTILFTALVNISRHADKATAGRAWTSYVMATAFGLIHGVGFSNYLQSLLSAEQSLVVPLLGFNLGLEAGQLIIVAILLTLFFVLKKVAQVKHRSWNLFMSGLSAGIALILIQETWPF